MIPFVKIRIEIFWSTPQFYMQYPDASPKTDDETFTLEVTGAFLHVDMAALTGPALSRFMGEFNTKPVIYHYTGKLFI